MGIIDDIRLSLSGLKPADRIYLLEKYGSSEAIFAASEEDLRQRAELKEKTIAKLLNPMHGVKANGEMEFLNRYSIRTLSYGEEGFPNRVAATPDSPTLLFAKGDIEFNDDSKWISIVGTRKASERGYYNCNKIVEQIAEEFPSAVIVSGLAYGIDITAHRAALKHGLRSVGVVAHGLDMLYPATHRDSAKQMIESGGAVITEFISGTTIQRPYFVQRNRIIAALSDLTIVVESAGKGGSLITADIADSYDREVFACPGALEDKNYEGCNRLIKNNKASLYQDISDIKYIMDWKSEREERLFPLSLTSHERKVYTSMGDEAITAEEISEIIDEPIYMVLSSLSTMEVNGIIKSVKARMYIKLK